MKTSTFASRVKKKQKEAKTKIKKGVKNNVCSVYKCRRLSKYRTGYSSVTLQKSQE